jgi:hypothetical protein
MKTLDEIPQISMDCYTAAGFLGVPASKAVEMLEAAGWVKLDYNDYGELEYSPPQIAPKESTE